CDSIALDLIAVGLLAGGFDQRPGHLYGPGQLSWYAARVARARQHLDHEYWADHTLLALARDTGMSPFHFARIFRELAGVPPHRYLVRRRLAAARDRIRDGESVTDVCYAVGFRSLSHFITTFRRAFGVSPSEVTRQSARLIAGRDTTSS